MTAPPAGVKRHDHQLVGVECSPAPRDPIQVLGVGVLALVLGALPTLALLWLSSRTTHVQVEKEC